MAIRCVGLKAHHMSAFTLTYGALFHFYTKHFMLANNQTPLHPLREREEGKFRNVASADGVAPLPCNNKNSIGRSVSPIQGATLPRDHRFDRTRAALQATCDNLIAHYHKVWFCTLTFVNPISPQSIRTGKKSSSHAYAPTFQTCTASGCWQATRVRTSTFSPISKST